MLAEKLRERWHSFRLRVRGLTRRGELDRDLRDELQFHAAMREKKLTSSGLASDEARYQAARQFGNATLTRETLREARGFPLIESIAQDARYAVRQLRRNSGFAAVVILTLALGIGVTTAVFSLVDEALFRPLPYPNGERLVTVGVFSPDTAGEFLFGQSYYDLRDTQKSFDAVTAFAPGLSDCTLTEGSAEKLLCARVQSSFLSTLEVWPILGRNFSPEDDRAQAPHVALLSYGIWRSRFGGARDVVGRTISLDDVGTRIVGVLPRDFEMPSQVEPDLLVPLAMDETQARSRPGTNVVRVYARLKPGVTPEQALEQIHGVFARQVVPGVLATLRVMRPSVRLIRDLRIGDLRLALWVLLGSVFAVLAIACSNVANLLLARAAARREEMAVRGALGAGRGRLIRQTLTESAVLGGAGGALGCLLAAILLRIIAPLTAPIFPRFAHARIDPRILLFTLAISAASSLIFGLAPALSLPKQETLAESRSTGGSRHSFAPVLVGLQVAGALVMLTAAGLLLRTLWKIDNLPLGMQTNGVILADVTLNRQACNTTPQCTLFLDELEQKSRALPGVEIVAVANGVPLIGGSGMISSSEVRVEGEPQRQTGSDFALNWRWVTPNFFSALKIHTLEGRTFIEADSSSAENLMILNSALAEKLLPRGSALGRQVQLDPKGQWYRVIGVVENTKNFEPTRPAEPEYYLLRTQIANTGLHVPPMFYHHAVLVIRAGLPLNVIASEIRSQVASLNSNAAISISTMNEQLSHFTERQRFNAILLSVFGSVSLLLAAIGLFGVISFLVAQRTREIGVRMALGASPGNVLQLFLYRASLWVGAGAVAGLVGSFFAARLLQGLLYGVPATDPLTWLAAVGMLAVVAFTAVWIPARRAARIDPIVALRYE